MDNIHVSPTGDTPVATDEINGVHYQKVIPVNRDGEGIAEVEMAWLTRLLFKVFSRFSFDATSQLRVGGAVSISSGTVTTVATCTTANMSIGDIGKPGTAMLQSAQGFYGSIGANFTRV